MSTLELTPIGIVASPVKEPLDHVWGGVISRIELDASQFTPDCLDGLDAFSHVEVIFRFHLVPESDVATGSRHPRNRTDWPKVGIFAQRGKDRPNRLGVTICRLLSVGHMSIEVSGLDAIDGTPVLDIKPWVREFEAQGDVRQPAWVDEIMTAYWETPEQPADK